MRCIVLAVAGGFVLANAIRIVMNNNWTQALPFVAVSPIFLVTALCLQVRLFAFAEMPLKRNSDKPNFDATPRIANIRWLYTQSVAWAFVVGFTPTCFWLSLHAEGTAGGVTLLLALLLTLGGGFFLYFSPLRKMRRLATDINIFETQTWID